MNIPTNLKYTKRDEWIRLEGEFAYVGITDYAQHELGQIIYADIDADLIGEVLEAEEEFGAVEANKTSEPLMMPVGGEIIEINELVVSEEYGDILPTNSEDLVYDALVKAIDNPERRKKACDKCYEKLVKEFTWDITAEKLIAVAERQE